MATMLDYRARMHAALNDTGWDGGWYRRGYYDSGAPLGSKESDECRIDALARGTRHPGWSPLAGVIALGGLDLDVHALILGRAQTGLQAFF